MSCSITSLNNPLLTSCSCIQPYQLHCRTLPGAQPLPGTMMARGLQLENMEVMGFDEGGTVG